MFSIILPLYNKELSIKSTINSILNQTYSNFELIIINDGSTDSSEKVINSIKDKRIKYIKQENKGVSATRNKGIQVAQKKWIAFIDADDLWEKNYLEKMFNIIQKNQSISIFSTAIKHLENGVYSNAEYSIDARLGEEIIIKDFFKSSILEPILSSSSTIVRKSLILECGGFPVDVKMGEDLDMWCRLSEKSDIVFLNSPLVIYRKSTENRACYNNEPQLFPYIRKCKDNLHKIDNINLLHFICKYEIILVKYLFKNGEYSRAKKMMNKIHFTEKFRKDRCKLSILVYIPNFLLKILIK